MSNSKTALRTAPLSDQEGDQEGETMYDDESASEAPDLKLVHNARQETRRATAEEITKRDYGTKTQKKALHPQDQDEQQEAVRHEKPDESPHAKAEKNLNFFSRFWNWAKRWTKMIFENF